MRRALASAATVDVTQLRRRILRSPAQRASLVGARARGTCVALPALFPATITATITVTVFATILATVAVLTTITITVLTAVLATILAAIAVAILAMVHVVTFAVVLVVALAAVVAVAVAVTIAVVITTMVAVTATTVPTGVATGIPTGTSSAATGIATGIATGVATSIAAGVAASAAALRGTVGPVTTGAAPAAASTARFIAILRPTRRAVRLTVVPDAPGVRTTAPAIRTRAATDVRANAAVGVGAARDRVEQRAEAFELDIRSGVWKGADAQAEYDGSDRCGAKETAHGFHSSHGKPDPQALSCCGGREVDEAILFELICHFNHLLIKITMNFK